VWGISQSPIGKGTLGTQGESNIFRAFEGIVGAGVWGDTNGIAGNHAGVVGTSDDAIGVGAHTNGTDAQHCMFRTIPPPRRRCGSTPSVAAWAASAS
jgi:hypothetical protein